MARRRKDEPEEKKKGEEEAFEFVAPEVDVGELEREERFSLRAFGIACGLGFVAALVAFGIIWVDPGLGGWTLLLVPVAVIGLRYLAPRVGVPASHLQFKHLLGNGVMIFFVFMTVLILLINPPIGDIADPVATDLTYASQEVGGLLEIRVRVLDNGKVDRVRAVVTVGAASSAAELGSDANHEYALDLSEVPVVQDALDAAGDGVVDLSYRVTAEDGRGNDAVVTGAVRVFPNQMPVLSGLGVNETKTSGKTSDLIVARFSDNAGIRMAWFFATMDGRTITGLGEKRVGDQVVGEPPKTGAGEPYNFTMSRGKDLWEGAMVFDTRYWPKDKTYELEVHAEDMGGHHLNSTMSFTKVHGQIWRSVASQGCFGGGLCMAALVPLLLLAAVLAAFRKRS